MNRTISILLLLWFSIPAIPLLSQETVDIRGTVTDKKTGEAIVAAAVNLKEIGRWTITGDDGAFEFKKVIPGTYTFQVQYLGYEPFSATFTIKPGGNKPLVLKIVPTSFEMEEVNVLAKKANKVATSTKIESAAIEYVQPTSLNDIMQLLPGNVVENPDMSKPQQISIREIGTDNNTAMGTSVLIDNAPVSNAANLQSMATTTGREGKFSTVAGAGVDLRNLSTDNIESVEVIKGIPSVVYGNLTSGVVSVKTKAGYQPLTIRLKADPRIKQAAINKGFKLPKDHGFMNLGFDYLSSYADVRSKYKGYKRLTAQAAWSKVFFQKTIPLSFNTKFRFFGTVDNAKTDPDAMTPDEKYSSKNNGLMYNLYTRWSLNKKFISNLNFSFSVSYTHQESYQKMYRSSSGGVNAISLSLTEGENEGIFLPTEQLTELTIDGKPLTIFSQLTCDKFITFDNGIINKTLLGGEYRLDGNYGMGQLYDISNPPFIARNSSRPRSFRDIPPLQSYSLYIEDKLIIPFKGTKLIIQGGVRLNNYQPQGFFNSEIGFYTEPRFNVQYELVHNNKNRFLKFISLNAGIGKTYRSPSLIYLYPDKAYYDLPVLDYYTGIPATQMVLFYSMQFDTRNPDLKPYQNLKKELGMDFKIAGVTGNITAFREKLTNGYDFIPEYRFIDAYKYITDSVPEGEKPDPSTLPKEYEDYIISYRVPVNNKETVKSGMEFNLNFGKIEKIYTSFTVDGAWLKTTRYYSTKNYDYLPSSQSGEQFKEIGVYPAGESKVSERFNTNLRMVSHIPALKMIFSTTIQVIWIYKYYYPKYDEAPLYLYDKDGNITEFTDEMRDDPAYQKYVKTKSDFYYLTEKMPPLFLANIRLSKEIAKILKFSFFVNNFLNYRPMYQYIRGGSYTRRNPSIYFGAEIIVTI